MKPYTIEQISYIAISKDVKLLSTIYKNKKLPLDFECHKHGSFSTSLSSFLRSHGCPKCGFAVGASKQRTDIEKVRKLFLDCSYVPLFSEYNRAKEKLPYLCPLHGESSITYDNLRQGKRCKKCAFNNISKLNRLKEKEYDLLIEDLNKKKIKPLFKYGDYIGLKESAKFECEIHGEFASNLDRLKYGNGCRKCTAHHSSAQSEISDFISNLGIKIIENDRKFIKPFEIDILCPENMIGLEYCGLWWHNEEYKNRREHKNKLEISNSKGINLITIFEDEWLNRKDQVIGYLKSLFNCNTDTVYARNTEVIEVSKEIASAFLEEHHIQGSCNFKIAFGIYMEKELLGIMTGGKHHRNLSDKELILSRMAFKNNTTVVGGASKLLKQLIKYAKNNGYSKLVSWSDNRWSKGNVYGKIGFKRSIELPPDYSYVKKEFRYSKQSLNKKKLKKMGGIGNTEKEMALSLGFRRIWDCGKIRWEINL